MMGIGGWDWTEGQKKGAIGKPVTPKLKRCTGRNQRRRRSISKVPNTP
ncbi:MAG: hypothetical protein ACI9MB_003673, partial [Verrucomicrobiales bacterium]